MYGGARACTAVHMLSPDMPACMALTFLRSKHDMSDIDGRGGYRSW